MRGEQIRYVLISPQKLEGRIGAVLMEVIEEESEVTLWTPRTSQEFEEFERFMRAADQIDWSKPGVHEVRY